MLCSHCVGSVEYLDVYVALLGVPCPGKLGLDGVGLWPSYKEQRVCHTTPVADARPSLPVGFQRTFLQPVSTEIERQAGILPDIRYNHRSGPMAYPVGRNPTLDHRQSDPS